MYILAATIVLAVLIAKQNVSAEVFTSIADMERLVITEKYLADSLKKYIESEEERLTTLKKFMSRVNEALRYVNDTDVSKYLGNPVNAYLMLKRFNLDWSNLHNLLSSNSADGFTAIYDEMQPLFPTNEDHEGAMTALFRLQDTYNLASKTLAKGIIAGVPQTAASPLGIEEIYELGRHAYNLHDWMHTKDWMKTALNEIGDKHSLFNIKRSQIIDYLAFSEFKEGNIREAYQLTQQLAELEPGKERILANLAYYREELRMSQSTGKRGDSGLLDESDAFMKKKISNAGSHSENLVRKNSLQNYEKLCRGEVRPQTKRELRRMKCWYKTNHPLLKLKPQKVERVWVNPEVFLFREILSDQDIQNIKDAAFPKLSRATIQDPITGQLKYADYRVSKSAWLAPSDYDFVRRISHRCEAATGLNMNYAEFLQVANYGIGGHYEPHFDYARDDEDKFSDLNLGNRIATLLFYLSNVEAGGATVFTHTRAALFPSKGDAAFWFNLKRNGQGNWLTRHAACPVLVGQKTVSNWWIHEYGQEFRRRCALNKNW